MRKYTVILEYDPAARSYAVVVPALAGCTSMGRTVEEALTNAREAITGHIAALREVGAPVPEEPEGAIAVVASVEVAA